VLRVGLSYSGLLTAILLWSTNGAAPPSIRTNRPWCRARLGTRGRPAAASALGKSERRQTYVVTGGGEGSKLGGGGCLLLPAHYLKSWHRHYSLLTT